MSTVAQRMTRQARRELDEAVASANYDRRCIYARLNYKIEDPDADAPDSFMKPVKFEGFANTGRPDLGGDIVDPRAFTKSTLDEFLKYGRQLLFMHDPYAQIGEITAAVPVLQGTRSMFGITDGGLKVAGFVDAPPDDEFGLVDHPLARVIRFARVQVSRGRLKLMSIGWRPTKSEYIKAKDPRRGGEERQFRLVKSLILGEISLVTMAMNPQAMFQLQKAYEAAYGPEISGALFAESLSSEDAGRIIPDRVDGFTVERLRSIIGGGLSKMAADRREGSIDEGPDNAPAAPSQKVRLVHLGARSNINGRMKIVSISQEG